MRGFESTLLDSGAANREICKATKSFAPFTDGHSAMEQVNEGGNCPMDRYVWAGYSDVERGRRCNPPLIPINSPLIPRSVFEAMQWHIRSIATTRSPNSVS